MSEPRKPSSTSDRLRNLRERIDRIDEKLQALISERAVCAQEIAKTKQQDGDVNFYKPEREVDVLRRVLARNEGPLAGEEIARLFREIMSACLALEMPMKIAFLGPEGTFTQAAALKHFGHSVATLPLGGIADVFREVESGAANFGVVPIENSTEGVINHTLDMFMNSPLRICGEVDLRIHHHLLGKGKSLKGAKRVLSHQQSLAQCREWLDANLAHVERVSVASNAEAARLASKDAKVLAIAGSSAAEIYGLRTLASNIEDEPDNTTRFLIVGRLDPLPSGDDKTSLLISAPNRSGSLIGLLEPFSRHGINMTRIESRPSRRGLWEYVFFVDVDGHMQDEAVREALADLEKGSSFIKWLGSYPKAVL
ncbi:MAG: prephenate dehydratase [Gammaproteobacteria bacterium]|nr:prephenate dehydratase [Gammaproteobacteria bacterium]